MPFGCPDPEAQRQPARLQKVSDTCHGLMVFAAWWPPRCFAVKDRSYSAINSIKATTVDSTPAVTAGSGEILNRGE